MKVLVVHNRYRSAQPSGEDAVVDEERSMLDDRGVDTHLLTVESDEIAGWPPWRKGTVPGRVIWSEAGRKVVRDRIDDLRPDVVHFHNTFPLLSPSALVGRAASGAWVVKTLHNFRPICPSGMLFRDGHVCEECVGRAPLPAVRHACYRGSRLATPRWRSPTRCTPVPAHGSAASTFTLRRRSSPAPGMSRPAGHPTGSSSSTTPFATSRGAGGGRARIRVPCAARAGEGRRGASGRLAAAFPDGGEVDRDR